MDDKIKLLKDKIFLNGILSKDAEVKIVTSGHNLGITISNLDLDYVRYYMKETGVENTSDLELFFHNFLDKCVKEVFNTNKLKDTPILIDNNTVKYAVVLENVKFNEAKKNVTERINDLKKEILTYPALSKDATVDVNVDNDCIRVDILNLDFEYVYEYMDELENMLTVSPEQMFMEIISDCIINTFDAIDIRDVSIDVRELDGKIVYDAIIERNMLAESKESETLLIKYNGDINRFCDKVKKEIKLKPLFNKATSIKVYPDDVNDLTFSVTIVGEGIGVVLKNDEFTKLDLVDAFFNCFAQGATFEVEITDAFYENDEAVFSLKLIEQSGVIIKESKMKSFKELYMENFKRLTPKNVLVEGAEDTSSKQKMIQEVSNYVKSQGFTPIFFQNGVGADFSETGVTKDLDDKEFLKKTDEVVKRIKKIILDNGFEINYNDPKCELEGSGQGVIFSDNSWGWYVKDKN